MHGHQKIDAKIKNISSIGTSHFDSVGSNPTPAKPSLLPIDIMQLSKIDAKVET